MSTNNANRNLNRVQVVPVTSTVGRLYRSEAQVIINGAQCKAMADQVTTVRKQRLRDSIGRASPAEVTAIEDAVRVQLGL